jgi:hypothetical protein
MIPEELRQYSALVAAVVSLTHRMDGSVEQFKLVQPSQVRSLADVFDLIAKLLQA